jgi:hypothetical protein
MNAGFTIKASLEEANIIVDALQLYRRQQAFSTRLAAQATREEKQLASRKFLRAETLIKAFGAEPEKLTSQRQEPS